MIKDYGFLHDYPYTNFHEMNLDWILAQMVELKSDMKNFVNQNTIKYADPIQWNITTQYEGNTVVIEPNSGNAYISSQPVPAGVAITNTDYWSIIGNFSVLYESIKESIAAADDGSNINATEARTEGQLLWLNSKLYKVLSDISVGALYITSGAGQNVQEVTIEELLEGQETEIENIHDDITIINSSILTIIGEIGELKGDLIVTTPEAHGATGDGVADDTQAFIDALSKADIVICNNNYKITETVTLADGKELRGKGTIDINGQFDGFECLGNNKISGLTFINSGLENYIQTPINYIIGGDDIKNVIITGCIFNDIYIPYCMRFNASQFITVKDNYINKYSYGAVMFTNGCQHIDIIQNTILDGQLNNEIGNRYPISVSGYTTGGTVTAKYIRCNYNYIEDTTALWEGIDSHGCCDAEFIGNTIINTKQGISLTGPSNANNALPEINSNLVISNNRIEVTSFCIGISAGALLETLPYNNILIENNKCITKRADQPTTAAASCINITGATRLAGVIIRGNNINSNGNGIMFSQQIISTMEISLNNIASYNDATRQYGISFIEIHEFWHISVHDNFIHNLLHSVRGSVDSTRSTLIDYRNNNDNGSYVDDSYITTKRSSMASATKACGVTGQFIPASNRNDNRCGWICIATGAWMTVTATSLS